MTWSAMGTADAGASLGRLAGLDSLVGLDPHLVWALLSTVGRSTDHEDSPIPVFVEALQDGGQWRLPAELRVVEGAKGVFAPFATGFVKRRDLIAVAAKVARLRVAAVGMPVTRRQYGRPAPVRFVERHADLDSVVIGIIDHGIAFASPQFAERGEDGQWRSRIERVWDQQAGYPARPLRPDNRIRPPTPRAAYWQNTLHYGYGRELVNTVDDPRIDRWLVQNNEADTYRRLQYRPAQCRSAHGTHVLGLAAGRQAFGVSASGPPGSRLQDPASNARIIAVQLPALPYKDTSGTGLCMQVIDAISYIALHAQGRKFVVNLSDGAYAGPHDGTSMLERALDAAFPRGDARHAFVVAAGNQFFERVHWRSSVPGRGAAEPVLWNVLPDDSTDSHLEIWIDAPASVRARQHLRVRVTPAATSASPLVDADHPLAALGHLAGGGAATAVVFFCVNPPNGKSYDPRAPRVMVHVAVAATVPPRSGMRATAPHGLWKIELFNDGDEELPFHARIERDNPALGDAGPRRQSHFVHPKYPRDGTAIHAPLDDTGNSSPIRRMGALNNVATAGTPWVVGGYVQQTGQLAPYSASGPALGPSARGVDLLGPSDVSVHVRGVYGPGVRGGTSVRMDGTSVAAPHVTRWIANWMAAKPSATDLPAALSAATRATAPTLAGPATRTGSGRL